LNGKGKLKIDEITEQVAGVYAVTRGSSFCPVATTFNALSGNGRCNALASSQGRAQPSVVFLDRGEDHRHRLGMDPTDLDVRFAGEEREDVGGDLALLRLADRRPGRPETGEGEEGVVVREAHGDFHLGRSLKRVDRPRNGWRAEGPRKTTKAKTG
jgi:hypothetical protein